VTLRVHRPVAPNELLLGMPAIVGKLTLVDFRFEAVSVGKLT